VQAPLSATDLPVNARDKILILTKQKVLLNATQDQPWSRNDYTIRIVSLGPLRTHEWWGNLHVTKNK
jgi:hypothetical protein